MTILGGVYRLVKLLGLIAWWFFVATVFTIAVILKLREQKTPERLAKE